MSAPKTHVHVPFPIPVRITVQENTCLMESTGKREPYDYTIPELRIRIGPLYDGSGLCDRYPDGKIRTVEEAKTLAHMLVDAWNEKFDPKEKIDER